jgi:hypothetical protein
MNAGLRLSNRQAYAIPAMAAHREDGRYMVGGGLALGTRIPLGLFDGEGDVGATFMYGLDHTGYTKTRLVTRARAAVAYTSSAGVTVFLGVARAFITHFYSAPENEWGTEVFGGVRL